MIIQMCTIYNIYLPVCDGDGNGHGYIDSHSDGNRWYYACLYGNILYDHGDSNHDGEGTVNSDNVGMMVEMMVAVVYGDTVVNGDGNATAVSWQNLNIHKSIIYTHLDSVCIL